MKKLMNFAASLLLSLSLMAAGCGQSKEAASRKSAPAAAPVATQKVSAAQTSFDLASIPDFSGKPYVVINDNVPSFSDKDKASTSSFEHYSKLDSLGRCGAAFANVSRSTMPTKKRGAIKRARVLRASPSAEIPVSSRAAARLRPLQAD